MLITRHSLFAATMRDQPRFSERGATLIEATIVLPVTLFVVFAFIDVAFMSARQFLFHEAVRSTGRGLQSQIDSCEQYTRSELYSQLDAFGLTGMHVTHAGDFDTTPFPNGSTAFRLSVQGRLSCVFCRFVPAGIDLINFDSNVSVIFEPGATCTAWLPSSLLCADGDTNPSCAT